MVNEPEKTTETGQPQQSIPVDAYAAVIQQKRVDNIIEQINPERILIDIDHRLKGEIKNSETGNWEFLTKEVVSKQCRYSILSILNSLFTQNTTLGRLDASMINNIMANLIESLRDDIQCNAVEYGLKGKYTEMARVCDIVCYLVFTLLTRAEQGRERDKLFAALKIGEQISLSSEKDEGFWKKMKVW